MAKVPSTPSAAGGAPDWEALGRFLSGTCEPAEAARVAAWLAANPDEARVLETVRAAADRLGAAHRASIDTEAALARVLARRDATVVAAETPAPSPPLVQSATAARTPSGGSGVVDIRSRRTTRARWPFPLAAAAALVLLIGSVVMRRGTTSESTAVTEARAAAPVGGVDSLRMPDGTRVVLGPGSELTWTADYGVASREVVLTGDGLFDVAPDAARPFTVLAAHARIVDVSTAFTVRSDEAAGVSVAVTEGQVRLEPRAGAGAPRLLAAGEVAVLAPNGAISTSDPSDADLAFTRAALVLRDTPVAALPALLARWYGVVVTVDGITPEARVTGTFTSEPRDAVLRTIALSLGLEVRQRGDTVTFVRASRP
jgi:transmembrane sensor